MNIFYFVCVYVDGVSHLQLHTKVAEKLIAIEQTMANCVCVFDYLVA